MTYNTSIWSTCAKRIRITSAQYIYILYNMYNNLLLYSVKIITTYINWCTMYTRSHIGRYLLRKCMHVFAFLSYFFFFEGHSKSHKMSYIYLGYIYIYAHFISILLRFSSESLLLYIYLSHPSRLVLHAAVALHLYCRDLFVPLHHSSKYLCNYQQTSIPYTI
jgi:hypothetical protein